MREILFRGKRVDNYVKDNSIDYAENGVGEWVYGDIIHRRYYKNRDVIVIRTEDSGFDNYSDYEVEQSSVGIFTGLYDKNDKKIFEGDIIKISGSTSCYAEVTYSEDSASYWLENKNLEYYAELSTIKPFFVEVAGNKTDSPELLKIHKS